MLELDFLGKKSKVIIWKALVTNAQYVFCQLHLTTHTFLICKGSMKPLYSISLLSDHLLFLFFIITKSHKEGENEQRTVDNILDQL